MISPKNFAKKVISVVITIMSELSLFMLNVILLGAFSGLTMSTFFAFQGKNLTRELIIAYVGGIALCISLSSVLFSYAKFCEEGEQQQIVRSGKAILNGGIILLISFALNYYQIETANATILKTLAHYTRIFALVGSISLSFISGLELHRGFKLLINNIWPSDENLKKK